jgi:hypothetical protein
VNLKQYVPLVSEEEKKAFIKLTPGQLSFPNQEIFQYVDLFRFVINCVDLFIRQRLFFEKRRQSVLKLRHPVNDEQVSFTFDSRQKLLVAKFAPVDFIYVFRRRRVPVGGNGSLVCRGIRNFLRMFRSEMIMKRLQVQE